jgi:chromosome segregation ATPase
MFDAFNSELKGRVDKLEEKFIELEEKFNNLQWIYTNRLESIDRKIGELKNQTSTPEPPIEPPIDIQNHDEFNSRIGSIEKKLLMGRWASK